MKLVRQGYNSKYPPAALVNWIPCLVSSPAKMIGVKHDALKNAQYRGWNAARRGRANPGHLLGLHQMCRQRCRRSDHLVAELESLVASRQVGEVVGMKPKNTNVVAKVLSNIISSVITHRNLKCNSMIVKSKVPYQETVAMIIPRSHPPTPN
jgi:hypothetical protein